jgi:hypothetical protein
VCRSAGILTGVPAGRLPARAKAEKIAEDSRSGVEELQQRVSSQIEDLFKTQVSVDLERPTFARTQRALEAATKARQDFDAALVEARLATARAEAEARAN